MKTLRGLILTAAVLGFATTASAGSIVFSNLASFQAATSPTLHPLPTGILGTSLTTTDGLLTLSTAGLAPGTTDLITDWQTYTGVDRLPGPDLAISGVESFDGTVWLGADRYAFGFSIWESTVPNPNGTGPISGCNVAICLDSTFTITLFNNGVQLAPSFTLSPADDTAVFWGVWTDFAFDAIQVRETVGGNDNEIFGTFYTGTTPVPEPATLSLLGLGLLGLGAALRARRK